MLMMKHMVKLTSQISFPRAKQPYPNKERVQTDSPVGSNYDCETGERDKHEARLSYTRPALFFHVRYDFAADAVLIRDDETISRRKAHNGTWIKVMPKMKKSQ